MGTMIRILLASMVVAMALGSAEPRPAEAASGSATLCSDVRYAGACRTYYDNIKGIAKLGNTAVGNDALSSLRVSNTRVMVFEHADYRGRCQAFTADTWTLVGSYIDNDHASSIGFGYWAQCALPSPPVRVTTDSNGYPGYPVYNSIPNLGDSYIGNDAAWGAFTTGGTKVAVYSDINYEGTCQTFDHTGSGFMKDYPIGKYRASSIAVNHSCDQDVQLCEHENLVGRCVSFRSDKPFLGSTDIGNDTASSLRVPSGWSATVYSDKDYLGWRNAVDGPGWQNLGSAGTTIPNDSASSIRVSTTSSCSGFGCLGS